MGGLPAVWWRRGCGRRSRRGEAFEARRARECAVGFDGFDGMGIVDGLEGEVERTGVNLKIYC